MRPGTEHHDSDRRRALQGVGGALLTPGSLAIISASFAPGDRANAIGAWSGFAGIAIAIGAFLGGYLVAGPGWRWIFLINLPLAAEVEAVCRRRPNPHKLARLGAIDAAMGAARAVLVEAASWIDMHPTESARSWALRVRAVVEDATLEVHERAGRAVGAGPLCRDPVIAQHFADLQVFVRQSHAEADLADLGAQLIEEAAAFEDWSL